MGISQGKINNLVQLYIAGYYSKPSGQKKENNTDAAQKQLRTNITRRGKNE